MQGGRGGGARFEQPLKTPVDGTEVRTKWYFMQEYAHVNRKRVTWIQIEGWILESRV